MNTPIKGLIGGLALLLAGNVHAELNWNYMDVSYRQPSDSDVQGVSGKFSANVAPAWVVQGGIDYIELNGDAGAELGQTRYDISVGRIFPINETMSAIASAGLTHVDYRERLTGNNDTSGFTGANVQVGLRAQFAQKFEANALIGVLADDEDVSDLLYELGMRYHVTSNMAVQVGVIGSEDMDLDEVLYELGFRFDLSD